MSEPPQSSDAMKAPSESRNLYKASQRQVGLPFRQSPSAQPAHGSSLLDSHLQSMRPQQPGTRTATSTLRATPAPSRLIATPDLGLQHKATFTHINAGHGHPQSARAMKPHLQGLEASHLEHRPSPPRSQTPQLAKRQQKNTLKPIKYLDGDVSVLPTHLTKNLHDIIEAGPDNSLSVAKRVWEARSGTALTYADGVQRKWTVINTREEVRIGRFKYGGSQQILVAQGQEGSTWEGGSAVIIGSAAKFGSNWAVLRGQSFDSVASIECVRGDPTTHAGSLPATLDQGQHQEVDNMQSSIALREPEVFRFDPALPSAYQQPVRPSKADEPTTAIYKEAPQANGGPDPAVAVQNALKHDLEDLTSSDSDEPIATQKRRRIDTKSSMGSQSTAENEGPAHNDLLAKFIGSVPSPASFLKQGPAASSISNHTRQRPSRAESVVEIKSETATDADANLFNVEDVMYHFVSSQGLTVRQRPFHICPSTKLLFRAADGVNIINAYIDKLTVTVLGAAGENLELNIMREDEEDFQDMKETIIAMKAKVLRVAKGTNKIV